MGRGGERGEEGRERRGEREKERRRGGGGGEVEGRWRGGETGEKEQGRGSVREELDMENLTILRKQLSQLILPYRRWNTRYLAEVNKKKKKRREYEELM